MYLSPVFAGLLLPFPHRLHPEPELVDATVSRLAELPRVLASCRANLDPELSAPRLVRQALGQAAAGPAFLRDSLPAEVSDPALRARLVDAAEPAVRAFEETSSFLTDFAETARARAFLADRELVAFAEGEQCRVVPAPPFQRSILAVASYLQPPALTRSRTGHFFVPFTPDGRPRRRSPSGCAPTLARSCPPSPCMRPTPGTTGSCRGRPTGPRRYGRCTAAATSRRAGRSTPRA